ncbi:hypothetical protein QMK19_03790 [Streptomyces sp. H10-C2]|uniref:hypothetical protein n=1 Tax=unclassified Streptomyces TaxID=2593676 RepID=UPI0024BBDE11|nr:MULTISPECIES: hypothetical protein [unclassified Streptomyces]MDJ0345230.1 hypothetical protein [Streptomyces sp. PH10-H1]MDJ0368824.1 hypothetical protein [Streptomyces sp. H10-C2]
MNTTAAATEAHVTTATIRTWARRGVIAATKTSGRWIIDATSLAHRIAIGARRKTIKAVAVIADLTTDYIEVVMDSAYHAADVRSLAGLHKLLTDVKTRNIAAIMGNIDPARVHLDDAQWAQLAKQVSLQAGGVLAEH